MNSLWSKQNFWLLFQYLLNVHMKAFGGEDKESIKISRCSRWFSKSLHKCWTCFSISLSAFPTTSPRAPWHLWGRRLGSCCGSKPRFSGVFWCSASAKWCPQNLSRCFWNDWICFCSTTGSSLNQSTSCWAASWCSCAESSLKPLILNRLK